MNLPARNTLVQILPRESHITNRQADDVMMPIANHTV